MINHTWLQRNYLDKQRAATIEQLNQVVRAAINEPAVHARLMEFGIQPVANPPAEYQALLENETAPWHALIREAGITLE